MVPPTAIDQTACADHRQSASGNDRPPSKWRMLKFACALLVLLGCSPQPSTNPGANPPAESERDGKVMVLIRFPGSEEPREIEVQMRDGETIRQVMERIVDPQPKMQGSGAMTLLTGIGTQESSGSEGWTYRVNGQWGDRSIGVYELHPGDRIEWYFGAYDPSSGDPSTPTEVP